MKTNIAENIEVLRQGEKLLLRISDFTYTQAEQSVFQTTVGTHIRHNLDHYACFLSGLKSGCIDYAARQRDSRIEQDRHHALAEMLKLRKGLGNIVERCTDETLLIERDNGAGRANSSITRELEFLLSHTIHHYAMVAIICQLKGIPVEDDFGIAPSTLRHRLTLAA